MDMKLDALYFWQDWPVSRWQYFFPSVALGLLGLFCIVFLSLAMMTDARRQDAVRFEDRLRQVRSLTQEILALQSQVGDLASLSPLGTAQQLNTDLHLEKNLASITPTQLAEGRDGVRLVYEALNLKQLVDLLQNIRSRGNLTILSCVINHREDNRMLADVQLVLSR